MSHICLTWEMFPNEFISKCSPKCVACIALSVARVCHLWRSGQRLVSTFPTQQLLRSSSSGKKSQGASFMIASANSDGSQASEKTENAPIVLAEQENAEEGRRAARDDSVPVILTPRTHSETTEESPSPERAASPIYYRFNRPARGPSNAPTMIPSRKWPVLLGSLFTYALFSAMWAVASFLMIVFDLASLVIASRESAILKKIEDSPQLATAANKSTETGLESLRQLFQALSFGAYILDIVLMGTLSGVCISDAVRLHPWSYFVDKVILKKDEPRGTRQRVPRSVQVRAIIAVRKFWKLLHSAIGLFSGVFFVVALFALVAKIVMVVTEVGLLAAYFFVYHTGAVVAASGILAASVYGIASGLGTSGSSRRIGGAADSEEQTMSQAEVLADNLLRHLVIRPRANVVPFYGCENALSAANASRYRSLDGPSSATGIGWATGRLPNAEIGQLWWSWLCMFFAGCGNATTETFMAKHEIRRRGICSVGRLRNVQQFLDDAENASMRERDASDVPYRRYIGAEDVVVPTAPNRRLAARRPPPIPRALLSARVPASDASAPAEPLPSVPLLGASSSSSTAPHLRLHHPKDGSGLEMVDETSDKDGMESPTATFEVFLENSASTDEA